MLTIPTAGLALRASAPCAVAACSRVLSAGNPKQTLAATRQLAGKAISPARRIQAGRMPHVRAMASTSGALTPHVTLLSNRHPKEVDGAWAFGGVTDYKERMPYYIEEALERLNEKGLTESPDTVLVPGGKVEVTSGKLNEKPQRLFNKADGTPLQWQDLKGLPGNAADVEALRKRLGIGKDVEDVILVIHGFNTDYTGAVDDARKVAAAFKGDAAKKVAVLVYDWAATSGGGLDLPGLSGLFKALAFKERSAGKLLPSLVTQYAVDSETARVSVRQLEWLLLALTSIPTVQNVHLLAHSMGNRVLSYAIDRFLAGSIDRLSAGGAKEIDDRPHKIGLCIFKQADLDPINLAESLARLEDWWRITGGYTLNFKSEIVESRDFDPVILAHPADGFLVLSEFLHSGMRRVGLYTASRLQNIFSPGDPRSQGAYQRLVGSGENSQDFQQWLAVLSSHIPSNRPEALLAVKKVQEMIAKNWDDKRIDEPLAGDEGRALKKGAAQLRFLLAEASKNPKFPFDPTGTPGLMRNARPFKNRGWAGHSYFGDPVFGDYIARAVAAYKQGFGPLTVDPLGSYEDLAVALWRMKQLWKCEAGLLPAQQSHPASSAFEKRLEDAVYGRGQDITGFTALWNVAFNSKPEPEPQAQA